MSLATVLLKFLWYEELPPWLMCRWCVWLECLVCGCCPVRGPLRPSLDLLDLPDAGREGFGWMGARSGVFTRVLCVLCVVCCVLCDCVCDVFMVCLRPTISD